MGSYTGYFKDLFQLFLQTGSLKLLIQERYTGYLFRTIASFGLKDMGIV